MKNFTPRLQDDGYSLVELMVAVALSTLIISAATYLIHNFFSEHKSLEVWSSSQIETSFVLRDLDGDIRNIIRMDPAEISPGTNPRTYFGLAEVPSVEAPEPCLRDPSSSVMRYTTLDRLRKSERLLRAWSEASDSGQSDSENELRVTIDKGKFSLFHPDSKPPNEIVIVDADRRYLRRYRVVRTQEHRGSLADPYDGQPKLDSNNQSMVFDYRSIFLELPVDVQGAPIAKQSSVFITGSEVYASRTFVVCLRKSDRSLIKFDQEAEEPQILVQNPNREFEIDGFKVSYLATKKGVRVEPASFTQDITNPNAKSCLNTVFLDLRMKAHAASSHRKADTMLADNREIIHRTRTIYSENITARRPVSCTVP